jgi:primosomal protein N' (replication factor Y)
VERFDWDALKTKNKYSEIIRKFENREIDILVGTQMLVKGLDFEHVNTVGVLSADSLLSFPDFRVNERVFQLLEQVSGRAGRKDDMGRVMIQLFKTNHPTILQVKAHDYKGFYLEEIQSREEFQYPPFTRLLRITLRHKNQDTVLFAAQKLAEHLVSLPKTILFGPAEPPIGRIRNQFIQEILLKMNKDTTVMQEIKKFVREKIVELSTTKNFTTVQVVVDVDPY